MKTIWSSVRVIEIILIFWFVIGMYFQHNVGLADNGDFTRAMRLFSSGPVGMETNWPAAGTEAWLKRFFYFWIPYWNLDLKFSIPLTSAFLLWLPGILLNKLLYSSTVLYIPSLSFFPKLIMVSLLVLLFRWIEFFEKKYQIALLLGIGVPLVLIFTSIDYVAYLNTFYQEAASFIFLLLFLSSLLLTLRYLSFNLLMLSLVCAILLATSKFSYLYWLPLAAFFTLFGWYLKKGLSMKSLLFILAITNLLLLLVAAVITFITSYSINRSAYNTYHSLFYGVLTFSDQPIEHLEHLGIDKEAILCVNISAYVSIGRDCFARYASKMSYYNTIKVIYREPKVIFRALMHVLNNMQDISLEYLGKYSYDDPRSQFFPRNRQGARERLLLPSTQAVPLRVWTELKFNFFPRGYGLAFTLIGLTVWFIWGLRHSGIQQDLSFIGLLSTIACFIDMLVAILGDGRQELIKHLFLSNLLFDIGFVIFLNTISIQCIKLFEFRSHLKKYSTLAFW